MWVPYNISWSKSIACVPIYSILHVFTPSSCSLFFEGHYLNLEERAVWAECASLTHVPLLAYTTLRLLLHNHSNSPTPKTLDIRTILFLNSFKEMLRKSMSTIQDFDFVWFSSQYHMGVSGIFKISLSYFNKQKVLTKITFRYHKFSN